jgi:hypothetical protein
VKFLSDFVRAHGFSETSQASDDDVDQNVRLVPMFTFSVSYDLTTKMISATVCIPLLVMALSFHSAFIGGLGFCVVGLAYAYSPRGYIISEHAITVRRLIGNVNLPLEGLREARITTPDALSFACGCGVAAGYSATMGGSAPRS